MTDTITTTGTAGGYRQGRRARQQAPRTHRVEFTLTDEEYAVVATAARKAGLARAAFAAKAALAAAAQGGPPGDRETYRLALTELMLGAGLVRRIAANLGQAAAKLNATGQPAGDLSGYAAAHRRRAGHLDAVADAVRKALP